MWRIWKWDPAPKVLFVIALVLGCVLAGTLISNERTNDTVFKQMRSRGYNVQSVDSYQKQVTLIGQHGRTYTTMYQETNAGYTPYFACPITIEDQLSPQNCEPLPLAH